MKKEFVNDGNSILANNKNNLAECVKKLPQKDIMPLINVSNVQQQLKVAPESSESSPSEQVIVHSNNQLHNHYRSNECFELVIGSSHLFSNNNNKYPEKLNNENACTNFDVSNKPVPANVQLEKKEIPLNHQLEEAVVQEDSSTVQIKKEADVEETITPSDPLPENSYSDQDALSAKLAFSYDITIKVVSIVWVYIFTFYSFVSNKLFRSSDRSDKVESFYEEAIKESVPPSCSQRQSVIRGDTSDQTSSNENEDSANLADRHQDNGSEKIAVGVVMNGIALFVHFHANEDLPLPFLCDHVNKKPPDPDPCHAHTKKGFLPSAVLPFVANYSPPLDELILDKLPEDWTQKGIPMRGKL